MLQNLKEAGNNANVDIILKEVDGIKKVINNHKKINIINAGLLKAGKSE